jgi:hypothetical protein
MMDELENIEEVVPESPAPMDLSEGATRDVLSEGMPEEEGLTPPASLDHFVTTEMDVVASADDEPFSSDDNGIDQGGSDADDETQDPPSIHPIHFSLLERVRKVFVEPLGYQASKQANIIENHLFIIHGGEHSGKLTCALRLAQDLLANQPEPNVYCYFPRVEEHLSLRSLVREKYVKSHAAYVIEDAFSTSIWNEDFAPQYVEILNEALRDKKSYLLLTAERQARELPAGVVAVDASVSNLMKVFNNHLDLYESGAERIRIDKGMLDLARKSWERLACNLTDPDQIDEFCRRLGLQSGQLDEGGLLTLSLDIADRRRQAVRPWFAGLSMHEKIFALLVVLVPGSDGRSLYEIFLNVVATLRDNGMSLRDPRRIGYDDLLDRVHALEGPTGEVDFHERAIREEVEWQVKNYNHLLWSIVPLFLREIKANLEGDTSWEVRRSRAVAIGRIGAHHPRRLREALSELAEDASNQVAAATGYALTEVCLRDRDADLEVCDVLYSWVTSGQPRQMWAAGSCIWRVYRSVTRTARDTSTIRMRLLETLETMILKIRPYSGEARKAPWSWKNFKCALVAISKIAVVDPEGIVDMLRRWLSQGRWPDLRRASLTAIRNLLDASAEEPGPPRRRHLALLELFEPVLIHCGEGSRVTEAMFSLFASWADQQPVRKALLKAANRLTGKAARAFREGLSSIWIESASEGVRQVGVALIMRSLALEGLAVPSTGSSVGALVLDASSAALGGTEYKRIVRRVWQFLQSRFGVMLVRMGDGRELAGPGQPFPMFSTTAGVTRPRLLRPALAALSRNPGIIVVLTTGPILDFDEATSSDFILVCVEKEGTEPFLRSGIGIDPRSPENGLVALAAKVEDILARVLSRMDSVAVDAEDLEIRFGSRVRALDEPASLEGDTDQIHEFFHAILGLARVDLDQCVALLSRWMTSGSEDLERRTAFAAARLLLRVRAHCGPPSASTQAPLFHLALGLGTFGPEGVEAMLSAVRRWLETTEWGEALLGPGEDSSSTLAQWIANLPLEQVEILARELSVWRRPLPGEPDDISQRVTEVAERMSGLILERTESAEKDSGEPQVNEETELFIDSDGSCPWAEPQVTPDIGPLDRAGFPMIWIEAIGAFMHWLPVTKIQFESFFTWASDPTFDDEWYHRILDLNPHVAVSEIGPSNYCNAFITGILPEEAQRFAAWCGRGYSIPTLSEWQKAYTYLKQLPADSEGPASFLPATEERVRTLLTRIESSSATVASRLGRTRTRADQMLMRLGVLEWVEQTSGRVRWGGLGEPSSHFRMIWSPERGPVVPVGATPSRSRAFGFRLIRRAL